MTSKTPVITVVDSSNGTPNPNIKSFKDEYDQLNSTLVSDPLDSHNTGSEIGEDDVSESDSDNNLDPIDDAIDPNDTIEVKHDDHEDKKTKTNEGSFRGRPSSCVFVASLAAIKSDDELSMSVTQHFQKWGELALVKVLRDPSKRPYAFVQYTNDSDARNALKQAQHTVLDGRTIRCEPAKVNRTLYLATSDGNNIGLKEVKTILASFGEVEQIIGNNDSLFRKSNLNKAWFCKFAYRDDAIRAYANLRLNPDWIVEWAQNIEHPSEIVEKVQQENEVVIDNFSIFVGQLDDRVSKESLNERFSRHGKIVDIVLVLRPGNNFAFIKFETEQATAAAVERENHAVFLDKTMHVQYRELHHKKSRSSNPSSISPRLNLAPPPVNLPYRRASTASGFNFPKILDRQYELWSSVYQGSSARPNRATKYPSNRSGSYNTDRSGSNSGGQLRFHTPVYGFSPTLEDEDDESKQQDENTAAYSPEQKHSPVSSPSNHTINSSHAESKSVYSSSTVSALGNNIHDDITDPTTSGYASKRIPRRAYGNINIIPQSNGAPLIQRPPSSYYYNYLYDQNQYLAYASYPYYFADSSLVDYPQTALSSSGLPPAPYYMYYGIPQASGFNDSKNPAVYEQFDPSTGVPKEMDY